MKIDTEGTYTLQYTAVDECGNETVEDRTVDVVSYRTVLYTDGTFIINEKSSDIDANIARHGEATNVYPVWENGGASRPWYSQRASIIAAEFGSSIATPNSTRGLFDDCTNLETVDLSNLDTSMLTNTSYMFMSCNSLRALDLSVFATNIITNAELMFAGVGVTELDLRSFDLSHIDNAKGMFQYCNNLTNIYFGSETFAPSSLSQAFKGDTLLQTLDLSSVVMNGGTASEAFSGCTSLRTIFASSDWVLREDGGGLYTFYQCGNLRGGAGTTYSSYDGSYARIDGGTANPGYFTAKA